MKVHIHEGEVWLPRPRDEIFSFFADAKNLELLTPDWLHFEVLNPENIKMRVGERIDYKLKLHGLPLRWQSEITAWDPPSRFIDEQRRGPYLQWVHEHRFVEEGVGTRVFDYVKYSILGGFLVSKLFVAPDLEKIFNHRRQKLEELFSKKPQKRSRRT